VFFEGTDPFNTDFGPGRRLFAENQKQNGARGNRIPPRLTHGSGRKKRERERGKKKKRETLLAECLSFNPLREFLRVTD
jgi:hypothetical protein